MSKNRAVTYNRYSPGPKQREESITGQIRQNRKLAKEKGLVVLHDYCDRSLTGRTDHRPAFQQMMKDAEKGIFDYVICYQTGRFARDRLDAAVYKNKLKKLGVRVLYSKMEIPDGPEGIILEGVLEALDEYYSVELSQKIMRGQYDNALQGKMFGGAVPYGYKLNKNKEYFIDEEKSPIVREIFERYAAGEKAVSIYQDLNRRGLRTNKGNLFDKNSIIRMFNNPKYMGVMTFSSADEDLEDIYKENCIPAIIDKELYEKAHSRLGKNKRKTAKQNKPQVDFLLTGKVFDGNCGGQLVGDSGTSKTGKIHHYYTCHNRKVKKICKTKSVKKQWLEDIIINETRENVLRDSLIEFIADCIITLQEKEKDTSMLQGIKSELKTVKTGIQNLLKAIEQGIITDTTKDRLVALEQRQMQLDGQLKIEEHKLSAPKVTKEHVIYWLEKFKQGDADDEVYRKQVIDTFVQTVIVNENSITIAYNYSGENDIIEVDLDKLKNTSYKSSDVSHKVETRGVEPLSKMD